MFRNLISKNHIEFKTSKQQDAMDYISWYLEKDKHFIDKELFDFTLCFVRLCLECNKILMFPQKSSYLMLELPSDLDDTVDSYSFNSLLEFYFRMKDEETSCPSCNIITKHKF